MKKDKPSAEKFKPDLNTLCEWEDLEERGELPPEKQIILDGERKQLTTPEFLETLQVFEELAEGLNGFIGRAKQCYPLGAIAFEYTQRKHPEIYYKVKQATFAELRRRGHVVKKVMFEGYPGGWLLVGGENDITEAVECIFIHTIHEALDRDKPMWENVADLDKVPATVLKRYRQFLRRTRARGPRPPGEIWQWGSNEEIYTALESPPSRDDAERVVLNGEVGEFCKKHLTGNEWEIIDLIINKGMSQADVARELKKTRQVVSKTYSRAIKKLQKHHPVK